MKEPSIEELKTAIAAVFLGEGLERMSEEQMLSAISMKRRWFSPERAKVLIENGKRAGLLSSDGVFISPAFTYKEVEIPFGYYPSESVLEYSEENLIERMKEEWDVSGEDMRSALSMNYNLENEVKLILWAASNGKDYENILDDVERFLLEKYGK